MHDQNHHAHFFLFFLSERYCVAASEDDDCDAVVVLLLERELALALEITSLEHEESLENLNDVETVEDSSCFLFAQLWVSSFDEEKQEEFEEEEEPEEEMERPVLTRRC